MNLGKTLFAQLMEFVPWTSFAQIVARYGGDSRVRSLSCTEITRASKSVVSAGGLLIAYSSVFCRAAFTFG